MHKGRWIKLTRGDIVTFFKVYDTFKTCNVCCTHGGWEGLLDWDTMEMRGYEGGEVFVK